MKIGERSDLFQGNKGNGTHREGVSVVYICSFGLSYCSMDISVYRSSFLVSRKSDKVVYDDNLEIIFH